MIISQTPQGSPDWLKERMGKPNSSEYSRIITTKGKPSESRTSYMEELAGERLSGIPRPHFETWDMKWGTRFEPEARMVFEMDNDCEVEQVGTCTSDDGRYGFSPDGFIVGRKETIEIKCPKLKTQRDRIDNGWKIKTPYYQQIQGGLLISGHDLCHCYSYYPGAKSVHVIVRPNPEFLWKLEWELVRFCNDLDLLTERLRAA